MIPSLSVTSILGTARTRARPSWRRRVLLVALGAAAAALLPFASAGCTPARGPPSGTDAASPTGPGAGGAPRPDRPYRLGGERVQQDVRDLLARVPSATPAQWGDIARQLATYGEPAVPQLVANLGASEGPVALMAAFVLGLVKDPRSLDALFAATRDPRAPVRYEAATAMLRMGDRRGLTTLVDGLEDPDPLVRARAILVLQEGTNDTFGYRADDDPVDRSAAVARWRAWLRRTGGGPPG